MTGRTNRVCQVAAMALAALTLSWYLGPAPRAALAQKNREREPFRGSATVKGVVPGGLLVVTDKGDQYAVKLPSRAQDVLYEGTAEPNWLRPGLLVEFTGNLNRRGQAVDPIRELLVFTPSDEHMLGLHPETGGAAGELFSDPTAKPNKKPGGMETAPYRVAGPLKGMRRNRIEVIAGNNRVEAELSEAVKIRCQVADLSLIRDGDSAVIEGWHYAMEKNVVYANKLTVTGAQPLSADAKAAQKKKPFPGKEAGKETPPPEVPKEKKND